MLLRRLAIGIWIAAAVTSCLTSVHAEDPVGQYNTDTTGATRAAAVAVSSLGIDQAKLAHSGTVSVPGVETLVDTTTPFVHGELNGKRVWRVNIGGLPFQDSLTMLHDSTAEPRDFTVFVDSASGIVLRVITRGSHFDESVIRRASALFAEEQLSQIGELYVGVPTLAPAVSLNDALKWSSVFPGIAMEVIADYLIFREEVGPHKGLHAAWVVNMNGGFMFGCVPDSLDKGCNNYRLVVDVQTGEGLSSTNWPNPPVKQ